MRDSAWRSAEVGFVQLRLRLLQPQLGVAMIEFADHLPLFDEIAHVHRRGEHAPGHQRRDVGGLVGMNVPVSSNDAGTVRETACAVETVSFLGAAWERRSRFLPQLSQQQGSRSRKGREISVHFRTRSFFG